MTDTELQEAAEYILSRLLHTPARNLAEHVLADLDETPLDRNDLRDVKLSRESRLVFDSRGNSIHVWGEDDYDDESVFIADIKTRGQLRRLLAALEVNRHSDDTFGGD